MITVHRPGLPRPPRWIPRQAAPASICLAPGCPRQGSHVMPSLITCPVCGHRLAEVRAVRS